MSNKITLAINLRHINFQVPTTKTADSVLALKMVMSPNLSLVLKQNLR